MWIDTPQPRCYDLPMAQKNIEKLEELVPVLITEAQKLLEDNDRLTGTVQDLEKQLQQLTSSEAGLKDQVGQLNRLEKAQRSMESDHTEVRDKVLNLLEELDQIELN